MTTCGKTLLTAALAMAAVAGTADAATLYYEGFAYDNTGARLQDAGNAQGIWSDSGTVVESGSLSYGDLATSGNKVTMSDDTSWTSVNVSSAFSGFMDDGDTLWFSVLTNTRVGTNPDFGFALATDRGLDSNNVGLANSGDGIGFRIKGNNGGLNATTWSGGSASNGTSDPISAGVTHLIVGEIIFGATDRINLYRPDTDLNLGSVVATKTASLDQSAFDTITFMDKAANPRDQVDEIRFGTSSADVLPAATVIPSPSAALIGVLGLGGIALRRRRG